MDDPIELMPLPMFIAMDPPERDPKKILEQRDDFIRICKDWLEYNRMEVRRDNSESDG